MTNSGKLSAMVEREARALGFHLAGIARVPEPGGADEFAELEAFPQWIAEGRGGAMEYLQRQDAEGKYLRSSLRTPFPWARSVIVCAVNYNTAQPYSIDTAPKDTGWIARYAWSGTPVAPFTVSANDGAGEYRDRSEKTQVSFHPSEHARRGPRYAHLGHPVKDGARSAIEESSTPLEPTDYHLVMRDKLEQLSQKLQTKVGAFTARCFVDTGPLVERVYAKYAGLGWQGKNTCLLNEKLGSWFFLGVIVTSLELAREDWTAPMADRCGSCTRCIDACPTQCLEPYRMDASRCIAYLTIEKRGEIPAELQAAIGRNVFGCDICQEVCPWNGKAPITDWPELTARPELVNPALEWLENLDEQEYRRLFRKSPISRTKHAGLQRNVAIAKRNQDASLTNQE